MPFCKFVQTYKMQRLILILIASFFLCISCTKSTPEGVLSPSKVVDLLVEVHLVDGYMNGLQIDSSRKVIDDLYGQVFAKNGIDSVAFRKNMEYYLGNPVLAKDIYTEVNKKLMAMERVYHLEDSIQNAFVTDSMQTVQRFMLLKEEAHRLILMVPKPGEVPALDYKNAADDFIKRTGLNLNIYGQNVPLQEILAKPIAEEPLPVANDADSLGERLEAIPVDTTSTTVKGPIRPSAVIRR